MGMELKEFAQIVSKEGILQVKGCPGRVASAAHPSWSSYSLSLNPWQILAEDRTEYKSRKTSMRIPVRKKKHTHHLSSKFRLTNILMERTLRLIAEQSKSSSEREPSVFTPC